VGAYDALAGDYDEMFEGPRSLAEDDTIRAWIGRVEGRVLDVGCGTGHAARILDIPPDDYLGVDPSQEMVRQARLRSPGHRFRVGGVRASGDVFDTVLSLYGSLGHDACLGCTLNAITLHTNPGARFVGMFFGQGSKGRSRVDSHGIPRWIVRDPLGLARLFTLRGWGIEWVRGFGAWWRDHEEGALSRLGWRAMFAAERHLSRPEDSYHYVVSARKRA
jgi:SAM-dependent methyltransferase